MKLASYMKKHGIRTVDFAREIGVTVRAVDHYLSGQRTPRWDVIVRIARATDNAVTANDWADGVEKKALFSPAA